MSAPAISGVVICDDVRQEANGKQIIIGVYGSKILVTAMPFAIPLSVWMEYTAKKAGLNAIQIKMSFTSGFKALLKVELNVKDKGSIGVATPPVLVSGASDGDFVVDVSEDGVKWKNVARKRIERGEVIGGPILSVATPPS